MGTRLSLDQLAPTTGASFDQPFELLAACHDKLERMLVLLERLVLHVHAHGADATAREAAADVARYFDEAAPQHHVDEERHLFPRLQAQGDAATVRLVARLLRDHLLLQSRWEAARTVLMRIADGSGSPITPGEQARLHSLAGLYREHLRAEDSLAYPAAQQLVPAHEYPVIGAEMMRRRQATLAKKKMPGTRPGK